MDIKSNKVNISKIIGYVLLSPAVISVFFFFTDVLKDRRYLDNTYHSIWTGTASGAGAGFTSALPFYFGLMALAGAYLIKDNNRTRD